MGTGETVTGLALCALVAAGAGVIVCAGYACTLVLERVAARVLRRRAAAADSSTAAVGAATSPRAADGARAQYAGWDGRSVEA